MRGWMDPSRREGRPSSLSCRISPARFRSHTTAMPSPGRPPSTAGEAPRRPRRRAWRPSGVLLAPAAPARHTPGFAGPPRSTPLRSFSLLPRPARPASCLSRRIVRQARVLRAERCAASCRPARRRPGARGTAGGLLGPPSPASSSFKAGGAAASNAALRLSGLRSHSPTPGRCAAVLAARSWRTRPPPRCSRCIIRVSRGRLGTPERPPFQTREAARRKPRLNERIAPRRGRHVGPCNHVPRAARDRTNGATTPGRDSFSFRGPWRRTNTNGGKERQPRQENNNRKNQGNPKQPHPCGNATASSAKRKRHRAAGQPRSARPGTTRLLLTTRRAKTGVPPAARRGKARSGRGGPGAYRVLRRFAPPRALLAASGIPAPPQERLEGEGTHSPPRVWQNFRERLR